MICRILNLFLLTLFLFVRLEAQDTDSSSAPVENLEPRQIPSAVPMNPQPNEKIQSEIVSPPTEDPQPETTSPPDEIPNRYPPPPYIQNPRGNYVPPSTEATSHRQRRSRLSQQEQEFINRREDISKKSLSAPSIPMRKPSSMSDMIKKSSITEEMQVEVVDEPITNLFRLISKTYKVNIVPESDLSDMRVTINLEKIPLMEGLQVICNVNNLEMNMVNEVIYIKKASEKSIAKMNVRSKRIDINVENKPVKEFIKEFAAKTNLSIVPGQDLEGKVTGHLKNVLPIDGLKALMSVNKFSVRHRSGIFQINKIDDESGEFPRGRISRRSKSGATGGSADVDVVNGKVTASLYAADLKETIRSIVDQAELNLISYGEIDGTVDAELKDIPVNNALSMLLQGSRFTFIVKDGIVLIGEKNPKSPSGAILSTVELHNLKYTRADEAIKLLPKNLSENTTIVNEQNAILVSGTAEVIDQVKNFLEQIDLPVPQVLIEVIIVEYERSNNSELGVKAGSGPKDVPNLSINASASGVKASKNFDFGTNISGSIALLPQNWSLHLMANLSRYKGKVLSMPKITTQNGKKAHLQVRQTFYHPVTSFNKDGFQSTDFRAIDDGITIDLQPWVTHHGDINLEIKPSIKTSGISDNPDRPNPVTDRAITTNVRLKDGETLILGGLIDSKEKSARSHVPILGHIPILGWLFSARTKQVETKELVIYVTPHVLPESGIGVDLVNELEELDNRSGFVEDTDFYDKKLKKEPELKKENEESNNTPENNEAIKENE